MSVGVRERSREAGISEVVGFVLIMGLLTVVASLYLTFGVPAQGRENEIVHMNEVSDQFVAYKINLDSLYTNNLKDTLRSNTFTLGTQGVYSLGGQSMLMPVMNPVASGGIMGINQRSVIPETLNLTSHSLVLSDSALVVQDLPAQFTTPPSHVYVNITNIGALDLRSDGMFWAKVSGSSWAAYINITPQVTFYQNYKTINPIDQTDCLNNYNQNGTPIYISSTICLTPINIYNYTQSDLEINVIKNNVVTMQSFPVYRNIRPGITYTIDLMDEAYGLGPALSSPDSLSIAIEKTLGSVTATGNISYNYADRSSYAVFPIELGSVEYRSVNNYWINQIYYYQMGGIVLSQGESGSTFKHPPEISFSYAPSGTDPSQQIVGVTINALTIDQNDWNLVGGNGAIQVKSALKNITSLPYAPVTGNTREIRIAVNTSEPYAAEMWKNYFNRTANSAGIPGTQFEAGIYNNESYILIKDNETTSGNDITVTASKAVFSAVIHGTD